MESIDLWVMVCALFGWACDPNVCESSCAEYRGWCGEERSYDCETTCENTRSPPHEESCAECWTCLREDNQCRELALVDQPNEVELCWDVCKNDCYGAFDE